MNKYPFRLLISLFILSVSIFVAVTFVVRPVKINDDGMYPTYQKNDYILANVFNKTLNKITEGQIAVIKTDDGYVIRRIIACPNSKIEIINNKLYVNNEKAIENIPLSNISVKTGDKEYFVMGDNKTNLLNSRDELTVISQNDIISVGVFAGGE